MTIKTLTAEERNDLLSAMSDLHKAAYGFRPRGYDFSQMSDTHLNDLYRSWTDAANATSVRDALELKAACQEWDKRMAQAVKDYGRDLYTVVRWEMDAEDLDINDAHDFDHYMYGCGLLPHSNELYTLVTGKKHPVY